MDYASTDEDQVEVAAEAAAAEEAAVVVKVVVVEALPKLLLP